MGEQRRYELLLPSCFQVCFPRCFRLPSRSHAAAPACFAARSAASHVLLPRCCFSHPLLPTCLQREPIPSDARGLEQDEDEEEDDMRWTDIVILLVGAIAAILLLVCYSPSIELDAAWLSEDAGGWGEDKVRLGRAGRRGFKLEGRLGKIGNMWGFGSWRRKGSAKHHDIDEL